MAQTIALVDDDRNLLTSISIALEREGYKVQTYIDGESALNGLTRNPPDLAVIDIKMPRMDGEELLKRLRKKMAIPIIFLTAKSQTKDVLEGFEHGGNDYLKKPFSMEELIVRIRALLNRNQLKENNEKIVIGNYLFNHTKQTLGYKEEIIHLTHREAELLFNLYEKKNEILDRTFILKKLWGNDDFFNARSMDVFISKLRKKLKKDTNIQIVNVRGFGYKLIC